MSQMLKAGRNIHCHILQSVTNGPNRTDQNVNCTTQLVYSSFISPSTDWLWFAKEPGEASAAPETQLVEAKGHRTHCISQVRPCLVSDCASCITHNHKGPRDPVMVENVSKENLIRSFEFLFADSLISMAYLQQFTGPYHICHIIYLFNLKSFQKPTHLQLS